MVFLNLLIWFYQNSEDDLDVSLETFLTDLLHTTSQCTVPSLREAAFKTITTKCLELLSTVNHKINFLKLPLTQFLRTHHDSIPALHSLVEIFSIVAEAKPKSL